MWVRICGYTTKAGVKAVVAAFMGMALASCGAIEIDNQARREGEPGENSGESEVGTPTKGNDGRMVQPKGHEGLWFETEPADPWERYVWLSQKYVGDPVVLGQLEEGEAAPPFVGEPDICSDSVVERMGELGFSRMDGVDSSSIKTCRFVSGQSSFTPEVGFIDIAQRTDFDLIPFKPLEQQIGANAEYVLREVPSFPTGLQCLAVFTPIGGSKELVVNVEISGRDESLPDYCRNTFVAYSLLNNIGIVQGEQ